MPSSLPPLQTRREDGTITNAATFKNVFPQWMGLFKNGTESLINPYRVLINHITNPEAWVDVSGWATYADAAASAPVDGTGGAPTVTNTRTIAGAELVRGTTGFKFSKDAANRQGEGKSFDFSIDPVDQGKELSISFDYKTSANYVDDDVAVFIYDVTNANLITPISNGLLASTIGDKADVSFTAASNSTSYRLILHVTSVNALAYDVFASFYRVGPAIGTAASGGGASVVVEEITSSQTWTKPTGVESVQIIACGGGGGGAGGGGGSSTAPSGSGGNGGKIINYDLPLNNIDDLVIVVGAGGSAGSGGGGGGGGTSGTNGGTTTLQPRTGATGHHLIEAVGGVGGASDTSGINGSLIFNSGNGIWGNIAERGRGDNVQGGSGGNGADSYYAEGGLGEASTEGGSGGNGGGGGGAGFGNGARGGDGRVNGPSSNGNADSAAANSGAGGGGGGTINNVSGGNGGSGGSGRVFLIYVQDTGGGGGGATAADDEIVVHTGNGHGSTNTAIRRFTTTQKSVGTDITYADSATNGGSFTINADGIYAISYVDRHTAQAQHGISKNSAQLTTGIASISQADILSYSESPANGAESVTIVTKLQATDVIRAHTDGTHTNTTAGLSRFSIKRIL
jgi:hypothetical protein